MASDDPAVVKELFMHLESPPLACWQSTVLPPRLPTGQVLRTHLITEDRVLGTGSSRLRS